MDDEQALAILKDHLREEHLALEGPEERLPLEGRDGIILPKDEEYRFIYGSSASLEDLETLHSWDHGEASRIARSRWRRWSKTKNSWLPVGRDHSH